MSTRGTYQFKLKHGPAVTFYIHSDNYPAFAWIYLFRMHMHDGRGGLPSDFIRANPESEITDSHEIHGDTEYRYTMDGATLTVHERVNYTEVWHVIFRGHYAEFINLQAATDEGKGFIHYCPDFSPLREVPLGYGETGSRTWQSRGQLLELVEYRRAKLVTYRESFPGMSGNIDSLESELKRAEFALAEYGEQELKALA